jgi:hypothetical protein
MFKQIFERSILGNTYNVYTCLVKDALEKNANIGKLMLPLTISAFILMKLFLFPY